MLHQIELIHFLLCFSSIHFSDVRTVQESCRPSLIFTSNPLHTSKRAEEVKEEHDWHEHKGSQGRNQYVHIWLQITSYQMLEPLLCCNNLTRQMEHFPNLLDAFHASIWKGAHGKCLGKGGLFKTKHGMWLDASRAFFLPVDSLWLPFGAKLLPKPVRNKAKHFSHWYKPTVPLFVLF